MLFLSRICCYSPNFFPELSVFFLSKMKSDIAYARAQAAMLRSSGHFNETEQWANKWSIRESFEGKPRSERPSVLTNCAQKSIENTSVERKAKQSLRFAKKYAKLRAEDWDNFLLTKQHP